MTISLDAKKAHKPVQSATECSHVTAYGYIRRLDFFCEHRICSVCEAALRVPHPLSES